MTIKLYDEREVNTEKPVFGSGRIKSYEEAHPVSSPVPKTETVVDQKAPIKDSVIQPLVPSKPTFKSWSDLTGTQKADYAFNRVGLNVGSAVGHAMASTVEALSTGKDVLKGLFSGSTIKEELANDTKFDTKVKNFAQEWNKATDESMKTALKGKKAELGLDPEDTLTDQVLQGIGSMAGFVGTGGVTKALSAGLGFAKYAPVVASGANTVLESVMEAQDVYKEEKDKGKSDEEAYQSFRNTLAGNALLIGVTNKLGGIFDNTTFTGLKRFVKASLSGFVEGSQEAVQQIISNANTDKPIFEGVKDSFIVGALLGAPANLALDTGDKSKKEVIKEEITAMDIPQEKKDLAISIIDGTATDEQKTEAITQAVNDPEIGVTLADDAREAIAKDVTQMLADGFNSGDIAVSLQNEGVKQSDAQAIVAEAVAAKEAEVGVQQAVDAMSEEAKKFQDEASFVNANSDNTLNLSEKDGIYSFESKDKKKLLDSGVEVPKDTASFSLRDGIPTITGIYADAKGTKLYERVVRQLKDKGYGEFQVPLQSVDSKAALNSLVKKGYIEVVGKDERDSFSNKFKITDKVKTKKELSDIYKKSQKNLLDKNNKTKLTEEEATAVAKKLTDTYWNEVIEPAIKKDEAVVIGADDLKDYFGNDYNDNNHPAYSKAAFMLYEKALKEVKDPDVVLTGGGPASGKTELIVNLLRSSGHKGIIYDSNMSSFEGAKNQIEMAKKYGKEVTIFGVLPNIEKARAFSLIREVETGRGISDKTFARGHAGFPSVVTKLLEEKIINEDNVKILDTRNTLTKDDVLSMSTNNAYVNNVLDTLKSLQYNEENIAKTYAKENYTKTNNGYTLKPEIRGNNDSTSTKDGTDTVKPSRAFERAKERLAEQYQFDVTYTPEKIVDEMAKAEEVYKQDPEYAKQVALGLAAPPTNVTDTAISLVVAEHAKEEGNYQLQAEAEKERSLRQTRRGQEIVLERGRMNENSPEFFIKQVLQKRKELVAQKFKPFLKAITPFNDLLEEQIAKKVKKNKKIKTELELKIEDFDAFLDSVAC